MPVNAFTGTKSPEIDKSPTMIAAWADGADAHISATTATNKLMRFNIRNLLFEPATRAFALPAHRAAATKVCKTVAYRGGTARDR